MTLNSRCPTCRKNKLITAKWRYKGTNLVSGGVTPDVEVCWSCHKNVQALILGQWSIRHYISFTERFWALMRMHGKLPKGQLRSTLKQQIPPTFLGWITRCIIYSGYILIKKHDSRKLPKASWSHLSSSKSN